MLGRKVMEFEIYLPMLQSPWVGKKFTARGDRKTKSWRLWPCLAFGTPLGNRCSKAPLANRQQLSTVDMVVVHSDGEKFLLTCACCFSSCMGTGLRAAKEPTVKMKDMAVTLRGVQNQGAEWKLSQLGLARYQDKLRNLGSQGQSHRTG